MNAEMKSSKWLWGGIGLQLGVGYSVGYLAYTVGTLLTKPSLLSIPAAIVGGIIVVAFAGVICGLIHNTNKKLMARS